MDIIYLIVQYSGIILPIIVISCFLIVSCKIEFNTKNSKVLKSISYTYFCFTVFRDRYVLIAITLMLIFMAFKKKRVDPHIQINTLKSEIDEQPPNQRIEIISEKSNEGSSQVPPLPPKQEPLNTKSQQKRVSQLSFLGDFKQSNIAKSFSQQPQFNVVKYSDDQGQYKFGVLQTLKSVSFDQIGKELEGLKLEPEKHYTQLLSAIEKSDPDGHTPMNLLYESNQPDDIKGVNKQEIVPPITFNIQTEMSIQNSRGYKLDWEKVFWELSILALAGLSFDYHQAQSIQTAIIFIFYILAIILKQISVILQLMDYGLVLQCSTREVIIFLLITITSSICLLFAQPHLSIGIGLFIICVQQNKQAKKEPITYTVVYISLCIIFCII